jgi:CDP-paratose 2-epimerase
MDFKRVLITGGAGFVGSNLAVRLKQALPGAIVWALDSLKRRGSELNLPRLREGGVEFLHGDIRCTEDLQDLPHVDLIIDCSAEPSVHTAMTGSARFVLETNLMGSMNCLEWARDHGAAFLFLSTSRVYPIAAINEIPFREEKTRFRWSPAPGRTGFSEHGIAEDFPLDGARSLYGASKLATELLIREYVHGYGIKALIDRCGIIAGPWQMGKVDQGVVTLWVARHYFRKPLRYIGFGGSGKQVRDVLHVEDLFDLILLQLRSLERWDGTVYNVGGGPEISVSLLELTNLCGFVTGNTIDMTPVGETASVDLRIYLSDVRKAERDFGWRPKRGALQIVQDIYHWLDTHKNALSVQFS